MQLAPRKYGATLAMLALLATSSPLLANETRVTDEMLANPGAGDWLAYGRASNGYRHSPLDQITKDNVKGLQLVWARGMEPGSVQITPIVLDGIMYLANPADIVQALDAVTGDLIWEYRRPHGDTMSLSPLGDRKRAMAIYEDKIFTATWDNHVVALDRATGEVVWDVDRGQGDQMVTNTSGPIIANGVLVLGSTCQFSNFGCDVTGHDPETGKELWRKSFIPKPGEVGDETWGNDFEQRWITGVWGQLTYDADLDLVYFGTSGSGPASEVQRGTVGGTMYGTNTRFAVRPKTGETVWRHQTLPRDNWDQECTFDMFTAEIDVNPSPEMDGLLAIGKGADGTKRRVLTGVPCKTGLFWQFDAQTGDFIYARATTEQTLVDSIETDGTVHINEAAVLSEVGKEVEYCPYYYGGRGWPPGTYDPETQLFYIPLSNTCASTTPIDQEFSALDHYNIDTHPGFPEGRDKVGRIDAIDIVSGKTVWSYEQELPIYAPLMSTAGGLIFSGSIDRVFKALDAGTGDVLWQTKLAATASGHPITYEVDGRQYVAIPGGGPSYGAELSRMVGKSMDLPTVGGAVYVFALPN